MRVPGRRHVWVGAALFVLFALLQLNDPDPLSWVVVYGMTALYSAAVATGTLSRGPVLFWAGLTAIFAAAMFATVETDDPMGPSWMGPLASESVREALGLSLVAAWSGYLGWLGPLEKPGTVE